VLFNTRIFRAELYAVSLALNIIRRCKDKDFIIFSDPMSSLQALSEFRHQKKVTILYDSDKNISHTHCQSEWFCTDVNTYINLF